MGVTLGRPIPAAVRRLVETLGGEGHPAYLVGGCVRDLLRGATAADFDVATSAPPETVLALFPRAIPIGLRHGTVMVPTEAGPVDVTTFRAGPRLEDDLGCRDFTVNAMAYDPSRGEIHDPFDGRGDLERGRLRAVRSASDRFGEDPLRALRAARLASTLGLRPDPEVERAMAAAGEGLGRVARERIRSELTAMLLGDHVEAAIELLRRTGLEARFAPDALPDSAVVMAALPKDVELRLAGWLRGGQAAKQLRLMRFARRTAERVDHLLRLHPIDRAVDPGQDASLRRLIKRAGEANVDALIALRRAEIEAAGDPGGEDMARLEGVERGIERVRRGGGLALRRFDLALNGRGVMQQLGCGPGPEVGRALAHLTDRVVEDPTCNTRERLLALLEAWRADLG